MKKYLQYLILSSIILSTTVFASAASSVAVNIDNNASSNFTALSNFGNLYIRYSPTLHQVYLYNFSVEDIYYLQYTFEGNTKDNLTIPYTARPTGAAPSVRIKLSPNQTFYISGDIGGVYDATLDVGTINAKFIWKDLTIMNAAGVTYGCSMNNQHISNDINRILMKCDQTTVAN